MAIQTNTVQTFAMVGIREDLTDVITNIAPTDTPFYSMAKKGKADNRTPEWLRDTLANPDPTNATIEGDDIPTTNDATSQPDRLKNVVQLFDKIVSVSDTAQAVNSAGRSNELKYQVAKTGKEIKRDIEMRLCGNYASVLGNSTTAGQCAGAEAWIATNASRGSGGAAGGYNSGTGLVAIATDGTQRTFTEALVKSAIKSAWDSGGEPSTIMVSGAKKQEFSAFTGIAALQNDVNGNNKVMIYGAADVYKSDFGMHKVIPNRFMGAAAARTPTNGLYAGRTALILDPSTWEVKFLQPFQTLPMARTGHAERRLLKAELTLACKEERANAAVADLT